MYVWNNHQQVFGSLIQELSGSSLHQSRCSVTYLWRNDLAAQGNGYELDLQHRLALDWELDSQEHILLSSVQLQRYVENCLQFRSILVLISTYPVLN